MAACGGVKSNEQTQSSLDGISHWEDCVKLDYRTARLKRIGSSWKIVEGPGGDHWAFDFGTKGREAAKALRIIRKYKIMNSCFVGRPDPSLNYLLRIGETAPRGELLPNEDCIAFNNHRVTIKYFPHLGTWKMVEGNMAMVDFGLKRGEALKSLRVVKKYRFNRQCFVGRPDPSFKYWKRVTTFAPITKPDLGAYGFLKIGKNGGKLVKWNEKIIIRPYDVMFVQNGNAAVNLYYAEKNYGTKAASGYANRFKFDSTLVSQQINRPVLMPGQKRDIHTQAYLKIGSGTHILKLKIDGGNAISESRENNNVFQVKVLFRGF